ncbi:MAG: hypothetical protein E6H04_10730 [Bacillati bacterium ANGP1]|uniref:HdeD family acid-resistance protein n=1 Tax=Candidatus Segetimicrobium genomatis TaxID=2569760 RepID=A0A537J702_9BACT|nr:MAG: hypothetical protein E6H04_10730 [Terrabacteria group bacterium ANGP1]
MLSLGLLARNWRSFVLRGVIAILIGVVALVQPAMTLVALVLLIGFWALIDGVLALGHAFDAAQAHEPWWPLVLVGLMGIGAGLFTAAPDHRLLVHFSRSLGDRRGGAAAA